MQAQLGNQFNACLLCGAIGDAWGSSFENEPVVDDAHTFYLGSKPSRSRRWMLTDDTQLTLATCEVLAAGPFAPELLARQFVTYYRQHRLVGLGASTLKAILDTEAGLPWTQTGRTGHYAAGNGAAMRIAPFAFYRVTTRQHLLDACRITHQSDEAYTSALAVYLALRAGIEGAWNGHNNLLDGLLPDLPDTRVKDRLLEISRYPVGTPIAEIARLGNNGYVVNSVPFALYCAMQIPVLGLATVFRQLLAAGGDTDTNASIAGQVAGPIIGLAGIPPELMRQLQQLPEYGWLKSIMDHTKRTIG